MSEKVEKSQRREREREASVVEPGCAWQLPTHRQGFRQGRDAGGRPVPAGERRDSLPLGPRGALAVPEAGQLLAHTTVGLGGLPGVRRALGHAGRAATLLFARARQRADHSSSLLGALQPRRRLLERGGGPQGAAREILRPRDGGVRRGLRGELTGAGLDVERLERVMDSDR